MTRLYAVCIGLFLAPCSFAQQDPRIGFALNEINMEQQLLRKSMSGATAQESGQFGPAAALQRLAVQREAIEKLGKASAEEQAELRTLFNDLREDKSKPGVLDRLANLADTIFGRGWTRRYFPGSRVGPADKPTTMEFSLLDRQLRRIEKMARLDPAAPGSRPDLTRMLLGQDGGGQLGFYQYPEQLPNDDPLRAMARSVVALTNTYPNPVGQLKGSGFCMKDGRVISAAHVLYGSAGWKNGGTALLNAYVAVIVPSHVPGDMTPVYRMFEIDANSIRQAGKRDLAVFRVRPSKDQNGKPITIQEVCGSGFEVESDFALRRYERISVIGFGERSPLPVIVKDGITMPLPPKRAIEQKLDCPIPYLAHGWEGMSGGPLIRSSSPRKVLGVVVWQPYPDHETVALPANADSGRCAESLANLEPVLSKPPGIAQAR